MKQKIENEDVQINGNVLSFFGHLLKCSEIIGISPLYRRDTDVATLHLNFIIYTHANEIPVKYSIERVQPPGDLQIDYDRVRNEYFKIVAAVEVIIKEDWKPSP